MVRRSAVTSPSGRCVHFRFAAPPSSMFACMYVECCMHPAGSSMHRTPARTRPHTPHPPPRRSCANLDAHALARVLRPALLGLVTGVAALLARLLTAFGRRAAVLLAQRLDLLRVQRARHARRPAHRLRQVAVVGVLLVAHLHCCVKCGAGKRGQAAAGGGTVNCSRHTLAGLTWLLLLACGLPWASRATRAAARPTRSAPPWPAAPCAPSSPAGCLGRPPR